MLVALPPAARAAVLYTQIQTEHRQLEAEKEKAEKELKELMARFKLRKVLV